jgi:hypothetical protein
MATIPSREDILRLLDELNRGKTADDLESEVVDFKPWLPDVKAVSYEVFCTLNGRLALINNAFSFDQICVLQAK